MIILAAAAAMSHATFDMVLWHITACACCHPGGRWGDENYSKKYKDCGSYALVPVILALWALAVFLVLIQATEEEEGDANEDMHINVHDWRSFAFLQFYAMELGLAWFVGFPIVGTLVFSGVLGCGGRLPVLGGRPRDVQRVEQGRYGLFNEKHYSRF